VKESSTPFVIFTDADCAPRPGFVAALLAPFDDPDVVGSKGAYETDQKAWVARFVQQEYEERYARMARRRTIDFIDTYAAAYRRQTFVEVGGFDERYLHPSTEDQELSFRLAARGARLVFAPGARVAHLHADSFSAYVRKKAKIGYYKVATLRGHPAKAIDDAHTPLSLKLQVLLAPLVYVGLGLLVAVQCGVRLGGPLQWAGGGLGLVPTALFLLTSVPLWLRVLRADPPVGLVAPLLILARATALGLGLGLGLLAEVRGGILPRNECQEFRV
jgi:hypothetical protein